ncbi:ABC transporter substrate-binding protein [Enterococcus sp. LJL120]
MKFKKLMTGIFAGSLLLGTLTACGTSDSGSGSSSSEGSGEQQTIRLTYWNSEDTVKELLAYLEEEVPEAKIEFQFVDNTNYSTIIDTQLAAGEGPDIISETPASALKHARLDYIEDVTSLTGDYTENGILPFTYEGTAYAVPGISWFEGLFYNKEIFETNGVEIPTSFDEFIAVCQTLQDKDILPLAAGLKSWEPLLKSSMAFVQAEYLSKPAGENFNEEYREGETTLEGNWDPYIEQWSQMIEAGIYTQEQTGIDHDQSLKEFATGEAAMFASGAWDVEAIKSQNPDLQFDMMPWYGTTSNEGWLVGGPGAGFAVNKNSKNKDIAMKVVEAIASKEGQEALWQNNEGGSSYLKDADFPLPAEYDGVKETINAGRVACPWEEWGSIGDIHKDYGTEMQKYLLDEESIADMLTNVDKVAQELLEKSGN